MFRIKILFVIVLLMKLDTTIKINPGCYHIFVYFLQKKQTETEKHIDCLNGYISQILEHIYGGSSTNFICITGISFDVYRLSKTGSKTIDMEKFLKIKTYVDRVYALQNIYIKVQRRM
jgi:hypothetical protein